LHSTTGRSLITPRFVARGAAGTGDKMGNFIRFETMITPILIQILFWLAVVICVIVGFFAIESVPQIGIGLAVIIFGPILARIYAEILIVIFRINDHLRQIQHNTQRT
jgi:hypothetical protein